MTKFPSAQSFVVIFEGRRRSNESDTPSRPGRNVALCWMYEVTKTSRQPRITLVEQRIERFQDEGLVLFRCLFFGFCPFLSLGPNALLQA